MELDEFEKKPEKKKTFKRNWRSYNFAQCNEFSMFQDILIELIDKLVEVRKPWAKKGRPFQDFKDMLFCCVMRCYFTKSSRRTSSYLSLAKGKGYIKKIPHFNTILYHYQNPLMTNVLKYLIEQSAKTLNNLDNSFAVDSSGFSTSLYVRWFDVRTQHDSRKKMFIKTHITSGVKTGIITAIDISDGYCADHPYFEDLVKITSKNFDVKEIYADAGYLSRHNMDVVFKLGGIPYIKFKSNTTDRARGSMIWSQMAKLYKYHQEDFMKHYHLRSNVESVFSSIKRKFGVNLYARKYVAQTNELLCKCLAYNICVLIHEIFEVNTILDLENSDPIIVRI